MSGNRKKLMLLGGIYYLLPVIKAAHDMGIYVITADYLPDNVAHKYADEYVNVSILDKEAVLKVALEKQIDGIMSFAVDPGVVTAAFVANKMGLPSPGPYESVRILQTKSLFRAFLAEHGFNVPESKSFKDKATAVAMSEKFEYPVIVKPVDAAGSKGVTRVDDAVMLTYAIDEALRNALSVKEFIIEKYIEKAGFSSDTDSFSINGKLKFVSFSDQWFDEKAENPYVPSGFTWPSTMDSKIQAYLTSEIQRLISLLGMKTSVYNIETRVGLDGVPYIMELSPRGGGNRLSEALRFSTGTDLIRSAVCASVGEDVDVIQCQYDGFWASVILHANKNGTFAGIEIGNAIKPFVKDISLYVNEGDSIKSFKGANNAVGSVFLRFDSESLQKKFMLCQSDYISVKIV